MSTESKRYTFEVSDDDLKEALESSVNRSEVIRDSLRRMITEETAMRMSELTEAQKAGHDWLMEQGWTNLDAANTHVSVRAQLDKQLIEQTVWRSLETLGLLKVENGLYDVQIKALEPAECPHCDSVVPPAKLSRHIGDQHPEVFDDE